jgi:hypothetical protein
VIERIAPPPEHEGHRWLLIHNAVAYWSLPRHERARLMAESEED